MADAEISEVNRRKEPGFDQQLKMKYGDAFWRSYVGSKVVTRREIDKKAANVPFLSQAGAVMENASSFKFVEWKDTRGEIDWRYVVTTSEDRPDGSGQYTCRKVFSLDSETSQWRQEATKIETTQPLEMRERVSEAIKPSLSIAIRERLGSSFYLEYAQAGYCSKNDLAGLPFGRELKKVLPKGNVRVRYLEDPELVVPKLDNLSQAATLSEKLGDRFYQAFEQSKWLATDKMSGTDNDNLPLYDVLKKTTIEGRRDLIFKYVKWIEGDGQPKFAYVFDWYTITEGKKHHYYQVLHSQTDKHGKADLISSFHPFLPGAPIPERREPCFVIEQESDGQTMVQVLRPSVSVKNGFEEVFIGVVDGSTKKCLVFNEIYPEVTFIQTSDKRKTRIGGAIALSQTPECYLPGLDLTPRASFFSSVFHRRFLDPSHVLGHELGHVEDYQRVRREGEMAYKKYEPSFGKLAYTYALPFLAMVTIEASPLLLAGNPTALISGSLLLVGNTIVGNVTLEGENAAEVNVKVLVQAARENGVELFKGIPDNKLPILINETLVRINNQLFKIFTKPKLPS